MFEINDLVRTPIGWEGTITAVEGDAVTVLVTLTGEQEQHPAADLTYNTWDEKYVAPAGEPAPVETLPTLLAQLAELTARVNALVEASR